VTALLEILPQLVLGLAFLSACLSYASSRGLTYMWERTFGRMLLGIAGFMNWSVTVLGHHIGFDFGGPFRAANNGVQNWLKAWTKGAEIEIAWTLRAMSATWTAGVYASEWLARETAQTFEWLTHVRVPKVIKYAVPLTLTPILLRKLVNAVLPHIHAVVNRPVQVIYRTIPHAATRAAVKVVTEAYHLPARVAALPGEVTGLTRRNARLAKRLHRVEALLGATVFAAALANVLGITSRCVRSGNFGRAARAICGLDSSFFSSLLGLTAAVVAPISIVELAEANQRLMPGVIDGIGWLVEEAPHDVFAVADDVLRDAAQLLPGV
jgi:hypothetical protein